ncbi:hypothetical protein PMIN01_02758 [Paraphaeosphaeria minitans]|uniref:Uncharacterized protein n=1 Tax=Paraphaeosphaeria minitans TaxID=565426 RepID=A0A9P6KUP1_9PLEO|nr:hypothetical protein PMIN01_02758 [Paraphaeosphaeria minitans]
MQMHDDKRVVSLVYCSRALGQLGGGLNTHGRPLAWVEIVGWRRRVPSFQAGQEVLVTAPGRSVTSALGSTTPASAANLTALALRRRHVAVRSQRGGAIGSGAHQSEVAVSLCYGVDTRVLTPVPTTLRERELRPALDSAKTATIHGRGAGGARTPRPVQTTVSKARGGPHSKARPDDGVKGEGEPTLQGPSKTTPSLSSRHPGLSAVPKDLACARHDQTFLTPWSFVLAPWRAGVSVGTLGWRTIAMCGEKCILSWVACQPKQKTGPVLDRRRALSSHFAAESTPPTPPTCIHGRLSILPITVRADAERRSRDTQMGSIAAGNQGSQILAQPQP